MFIDVINFKEHTKEEYKKKTAMHWDRTPCGSRYVPLKQMNKVYFEKQKESRYSDDLWLVDEIASLNVKGKKVLEVGYGMGTDHLELAKKGGIMHGISITPHDKEITDKRFEIYGYESDTIVGDAENMPYANSSFDFVYSVGVLHHCPDFDKSLKEIYRVLKPGGEAYIAVYNRDSVFFWWTLFFCGWILNPKFWKYTLKQRISLLEYPNDDPNLVVKLFTKKQFIAKLREMKFTVKSIKIRHLTRDSIAYNKFFSDKFICKMEKKGGWYLIARVKK